VAAVERGDWHGLIDRRGRFVWGATTERCCLVRTVESEWAQGWRAPRSGPGRRQGDAPGAGRGRRVRV